MKRFIIDTLLMLALFCGAVLAVGLIGKVTATMPLVVGLFLMAWVAGSFGIALFMGRFIRAGKGPRLSCACCWCGDSITAGVHACEASR